MRVELPQSEPFSIADAARVIEHPETPAAFVTWLEILPLTGKEDRVHLGNLLNWSKASADRTLGASRRVFEQALNVADDDLVDSWMEALSRTSSLDFLDHHVPFLRNLLGWESAERRRESASAYLKLRTALPVIPVSRMDGKMRRDFPDSVIIEITRSCNFACEMCSSRTGGFRSDRTMPLEVFGEFVRVFGPGAKSLRVNGYGETSIVPGLSRYLDCLDEFGVTAVREIITNLSAPDPVYADLLDRGFVIMVSWDATDRAIFERIRCGAIFDELLARLRHLGERARRQPERLGLLMTVQECNLEEVGRIVKLAGEIGAGLVIFNMVKEAGGSPWMDARNDEIRAVFEEAHRLARTLGIDTRIPDHVGSNRLRVPGTRRSSGTFCDRPWREILIRWDGEATVCNMFNPYSYGQLTPPGPAQSVEARFRRLWNGPNARLFRQEINSQHPHPYCENCYFLYP